MLPNPTLNRHKLEAAYAMILRYKANNKTTMKDKNKQNLSGILLKLKAKKATLCLTNIPFNIHFLLSKNTAKLDSVTEQNFMTHFLYYNIFYLNMNPSGYSGVQFK